MNFNKLPIEFHALYDYGSRKSYPTLAVVFHMAEGVDVAQFLAHDSERQRKYGVSSHYTIEQETKTWKDGQIVRILPENRISGSLDPRRVRTSNDRFYGARHAKAALGKWWKNPNVVVISVEVAGEAQEGPTKAQKESMVKLFFDIRSRFPKVVPLGHRDFADYKPCPGTTTRIKNAFRDMGGHGLDYEYEVKPTVRETLKSLRQDRRTLRNKVSTLEADIENQVQIITGLREDVASLEQFIDTTYPIKPEDIQRLKSILEEGVELLLPH